jgi:hypothetical protein
VPHEVQVRVLQDVVNICPKLGLLLWILLPPFHSLIEITIEPLDLTSAVITEKEAASNVNRSRSLQDVTSSICEESLVTVASPESRLLAKTAPLVVRLFKGLAIARR